MQLQHTYLANLMKLHFYTSNIILFQLATAPDTLKGLKLYLHLPTVHCLCNQAKKKKDRNQHKVLQHLTLLRADICI